MRLTQIAEALAVGASRDPTDGTGGGVAGKVAWWRVGSLYLFRLARMKTESPPPTAQLHLAGAQDIAVLLRLRISHCGLNPANGDEFAFAVSSLGDLDGDGVDELAVAAPYRESPIYSYTDAGVVCIMFLSQAEKETTGQISVKFSNVISLDTLEDAGTEETRALMKHNSLFGCALASLGDVNGDGVPDMAASMCGADDEAGAVVILHLSAAGQVLAAKTMSKTAQGLGYLPLIMHDILPLHHSSLAQLRFGEALAAVGDVDGDGYMELAVSVGRERVLVLLSLTSSGTLKGSKLVKDASGAIVNIATRALSAAADWNGDSVPDILYGGNGTVVLLLLHRNATVGTKQSIVFTRDYLFAGLDLGEKETHASQRYTHHTYKSARGSLWLSIGLCVKLSKLTQPEPSTQGTRQAITLATPLQFREISMETLLLTLSLGMLVFRNSLPDSRDLKMRTTRVGCMVSCEASLAHPTHRNV